MAVKVRIRGEWIQHGEGEAIDVVDGHLHVSKGAIRVGTGKVIATYAPTIWTRAEVLPAQKSSADAQTSVSG
ncbi:hypothetical protein LL946_11080 [Knoellia locipacati]|uniref:hypothetical protein n=1 Tax=Knoellia locipacati TaxID=882824 RepID=UPI00385082D8